MFSASNANQDDGDDPYGFDVDFSSKKFKPSYAQSSFDDEDDIVFSDSEDEGEGPSDESSLASRKVGRPPMSILS